MSITITEALAEVKTIGKRITKKQQSIMPYIGRQDGVKDPLEKDGGSPEFIKRERQAIGDLEKRIIEIRRGIQRANDETSLTINDTTMTVSEWLTWRREVVPIRKQTLEQFRNGIGQLRAQASRGNAAVVQANAISGELKPTDYIINISEKDLAEQIEVLEDTLGQLDGKLSLLNATTQIKE